MSHTFPKELRYAKSHEWVRKEGDEWVCGISDLAQDLLSDVVYVELPEVGASFKQSDVCATVESVKSAEDINAPLSGTVTAVNEDLGDTPELVNEDPYGKGWFLRLKATAADDEMGNLLDAAAYESYAKEEAEKSGH